MRDNLHWLGISQHFGYRIEALVAFFELIQSTCGTSVALSQLWQVLGRFAPPLVASCGHSCKDLHHSPLLTTPTGTHSLLEVRQTEKSNVPCFTCCLNLSHIAMVGLEETL